MKQIIKSPWSILLGMVGGVGLGLASTPISQQLAPIGDLYLTFLTMCVIPIMVTAVVSSFGRLLSTNEASQYLKRVGVVFTCGLLITATVGLGMALLGNPGAGLSEETRVHIGTLLLQAEKQAPMASTVPAGGRGWSGFLQLMIPNNIFGALSEGKNLQILFFSLVFGLAIGLVSSDHRSQFLDLIEVIFKAFVKVIGIAMYFLPIGLFCMIAGQVAGAGVGILLAMGRYVVVVHLAVLVLLIAGGLLISWAGRRPFFSTFSDLREPLVVAFATRNSYAAMPSMLNALRHHFNLPPESINLVVPLSVVICRYSMILVFTIGSVFVAQLYNAPLGGEQLGIIFGCAMLAMLAVAGSPSVVALSMISMVLIPLGLPVNAAIILLLAVNFIVDPALTILNVYLACVATVVISYKRKTKQPELYT